MPSFMERRRLARSIDRVAKQIESIDVPERGWIASVRLALGMSAEHVAQRKGVSRNAVYQAERSEKDGAVSLKQMDLLSKAMGCKFVYAIVPEGRIDDLKFTQAKLKATQMAIEEPDFSSWSQEEREDWIDDKSAELLHDMPSHFWESDAQR